MSNFDTLLLAVLENTERTTMTRLEKQAFKDAVDASSAKYHELILYNKPLEVLDLFLQNKVNESKLKQRTFVWYSNPNKYTLSAYKHALDIFTSMSKRFSTDPSKW